MIYEILSEMMDTSQMSLSEFHESVYKLILNLPKGSKDEITSIKYNHNLTEFQKKQIIKDILKNELEV